MSAVPPAVARPLAAGRQVFGRYLQATRHSHRLNGMHPRRALRRFDDRPVFVVGSPRSGTTFTAETIAAVPGFVDLGELKPLKGRLPELVELPPEVAGRRVRRILARSQRVGLTSGERGIEQTPETTFLIPAIATDLPGARFVHLTRDGRDVVASLLAKGWLGQTQRTDEVGQVFGRSARFWVEPGRAEEFEAASEVRRAAWVWRRYETTASASLAELPGRALAIRYEEMVADPAATGRRVAAFLDAGDRETEFVRAFAAARTTASGRWRTDLSAEALAEVEAEAGPLLRELGYPG
ncbi:sulfotransferase family protein [Jatrophihabitans sp. YIM 134969]